MDSSFFMNSNKRIQRLYLEEISEIPKKQKEYLPDLKEIKKRNEKTF